MSFSQFIQNIVSYLLGFVALIAVLLIIWAGFMILTAAGDEAKVKKAYKTIIYVIIGIVVMYLAYSIVLFVINVLTVGGASGSTGATYIPTISIDRAYADSAPTTLSSSSDPSSNSIDPNSLNTFDQFSTQIQLLQPEIEREFKINNKIDLTTLGKLQALVQASESTFPDNTDQIFNANLANNVITSIELVQKKPDSQSAILGMAKDLVDYLSKVKIGRITSGMAATPAQGNAPLTVSLQATNSIDPSGVVIPQNNYLWSIQTGDGQMDVIGVGQSIVYTFTDQNTYTVFLDINSPSRNKNGKTDVLPFHSSITVNVLPKIGAVNLSINGVNVSSADSYKITPAAGQAGVIMDASTTYAEGSAQITGYTWDFGNGVTDTENGTPQIASQIYANPGTYHPNLTLQLNTGKTMQKKLNLEVRDPVAYIQYDKNNTHYAHDTLKFTAVTSLDTSTL